MPLTFSLFLSSLHSKDDLPQLIHDTNLHAPSFRSRPTLSNSRLKPKHVCIFLPSFVVAVVVVLSYYSPSSLFKLSLRDRDDVYCHSRYSLTSLGVLDILIIHASIIIFSIRTRIFFLIGGGDGGGGYWVVILYFFMWRGFSFLSLLQGRKWACFHLSSLLLVSLLC